LTFYLFAAISTSELSSNTRMVALVFLIV